MPYLILVIGLLIAAYAVYRFFLNADVRQIKAFFLAIIAVAISLALLVMALTGRLAAALGLAAVLLPFVVKYLQNRKKSGASFSPESTAMTEKEALDILGLPPCATPDDIEQAYKKLMIKVHPDTQGSDWMAVKLNQARDLLLGE